jgi:endoglucanase
LEPTLPTPPPGSVAGGPNSVFGTWDPVISGLYTTDHMCAPQLCYVDEIQSWSTNEITVNWNSAMSWVASFVADQQDGDESAAGVVAWAVTDPADVAAAAGTTVSFTTSATGDPDPSVQWQRLVGGVWTDLVGSTGRTLSFTATLADDGSRFRAYVANDFGGAYTDPATLTVTAAVVPVPASTPAVTPTPSVAPTTSATPPGSSGALAATGSDIGRMGLAALVLLVAGASAVLGARRMRRA